MVKSDHVGLASIFVMPAVDPLNDTMQIPDQRLWDPLYV